VFLDVSDNDPTRFLLYIAAACDRVQPGLGETTRNMLQSPQPLPTDVVLTVLLNEISALDRSLTLVLDDYHLIETQAVRDALVFLLDHQPSSLRVILATRVDPPLPLSRMRVRGQLTELRANDLRFTHDEAAAFLNQAMGLNLDAEAVSRLEARTEGWIAGLQLAALSLQGRANPSEFLDSFTGSNRYIVDYLFDEVLSRQPESVQTFLQKTSILNRLCGPLCEAVTGQPGGQAQLEHLEAGNLFLIPLDDERRWYRYHHLFADVLKARLAQQGAECAVELHGRAATWFEQQGMGEEAVHHALAGNHTEQAAGLIERHAQEVWERGERYTLEEWLRALPVEIIRKRSWLCVHQSTLYLYQLQIRAAEEILEGCPFDGRQGDAHERDIQGRLLVVRALLTRLTNDLERSEACIHEALPLLASDNTSWRAAAYLNLGMLHFEANRLREADESYLAAIAECQTVPTFYIRIMATVTRAQIREAQGALREAGDLYYSLLQLATERKALHLTEINLIHAGLARLHYQWNDLPAALNCLRESSSRKGAVLLEAALLEVIRVKSALGDREGATAALDEMETLARQTDYPGLKAVVELFRVRTQAPEGEVARKWLAW
jgi:LuxR family maltose regulon positive regulatory protein